MCKHAYVVETSAGFFVPYSNLNTFETRLLGCILSDSVSMFDNNLIHLRHNYELYSTFDKKS